MKRTLLNWFITKTSGKMPQMTRLEQKMHMRLRDNASIETNMTARMKKRVVEAVKRNIIILRELLKERNVHA